MHGGREGWARPGCHGMGQRSAPLSVSFPLTQTHIHTHTHTHQGARTLTHTRTQAHVRRCVQIELERSVHEGCVALQTEKGIKACGQCNSSGQGDPQRLVVERGERRAWGRHDRGSRGRGGRSARKRVYQDRRQHLHIPAAMRTRQMRVRETDRQRHRERRNVCARLGDTHIHTYTHSLTHTLTHTHTYTCTVGLCGSYRVRNVLTTV
jgi:hypothetical protein